MHENGMLDLRKGVPSGQAVFGGAFGDLPPGFTKRYSPCQIYYFIRFCPLPASQGYRQALFFSVIRYRYAKNRIGFPDSHRTIAAPTKQRPRPTAGPVRRWVVPKPGRVAPVLLLSDKCMRKPIHNKHCKLLPNARCTC
jgi:hypothetical protein